MEQPIRFCTTSDGVTIAYKTYGEGRPLLFMPGWVSHLELEQASPGLPQLIEGLMAGGRRQVIRYDCRGTGLSDRKVDDLSLPARVRDVEAVVESLNLSSFAMLAWSQAGPPAIVYAVEHPGKVAHLILCASFARSFGQGHEELNRAVLALMRAEWSIGSKTVVDFVYPEADRDYAQLTSQYFRAASSAEVATAILEEGMFQTDVTEYLPRLIMPALVLHRREDRAVPFECGRQLAALIPGSRFMPLPGSAHVPFLGDVAAVLGAIDEFLGEAAGPALPAAHPRHRGADLHIILFTDIVASTNLTQQLGDAKAQTLVRTHNAIVREALKAHDGEEIKQTGDGLMASFHAASGAIECAVAIQQALAGHNEGHPDTPLRVRIGLNAGEPVAEESDLFGTAVQLAARICAEAEPGRILVSDVVRQLAAGKGFLFADTGEVVLKGFEEPVRLHEVRWEA